jgi:hypothetical protein
MNAFFALFQDTSFWAGVAGLILSIVGVRFLLRALHAQPEERGSMADDSPEDEAPSPAAKPEFKEPESTTRIAARPAGPSLEALDARLTRIEQSLEEISSKLSSPSGKSAASGPQLDQIASKIEKIYQVLAQISTEENPK